ncbi:MAG: hypothetical protein KAG18_06150 [Sinobacterium sp.]|nr:hypothetical protein [Sinobacterium sp.]
MKRRNSEDWKQLISEQASSGKSAVEFCSEQQINPKYFSLRKNRLKNESSNFVKASIIPHPPAMVTLQKKDVILTLSNNTSAQWLAQLIRELAA